MERFLSEMKTTNCVTELAVVYYQFFASIKEDTYK